MSCRSNCTGNENDDCQKTYLLTNVAVIKNIKRIKIQKMKEQNRRRETIIVTTATKDCFFLYMQQFQYKSRNCQKKIIFESYFLLREDK